MSFWEETCDRHGLTATSGFLLGGNEPGMADVVTATLWATMTDRFPRIGRILRDAAPRTAALSRRVADMPPLADLMARTRADYGDTYCGGEVEKSLREVLAE